MNASPTQKTPLGNRGRGIEVSVFAELTVLVMVPVFALGRLATWIDWRVVLGGSVGMSLIAYFIYGFDKRRAETNGQRVPETILHAVELFGGWPGAFLAQRKLRHKTSKTSYQVVFWLIILAHQFAALDFLLRGRLTQGLIHLIKAPTD